MRTELTGTPRVHHWVMEFARKVRHKGGIRYERWAGARTLRSEWGGGTVHYYRTINLANGQEGPIGSGTHFDLPHGHVLVESGFFCGKPAAVVVEAHPEDLEEQPIPERTDLSWEEIAVLVCTANYKSFCRKEYAQSHAGISGREWDHLRAKLEAKFLLSRGALTPEGRRACPVTDLTRYVRQYPRPPKPEPQTDAELAARLTTDRNFVLPNRPPEPKPPTLDLQDGLLEW